MKLISEADSSLEAQADEVTLNVLSARLGALLTQLNEVDAAVEPLVPDKEVDENYARTIAYNDRIVACVARLNQQAGAQRANAITAAVASRASRDGNLRANGSKVKCRSSSCSDLAAPPRSGSLSGSSTSKPYTATALFRTESRVPAQRVGCPSGQSKLHHWGEPLEARLYPAQLPVGGRPALGIKPCTSRS
ncbi:hypothetical protein HPB51_024295 [Rhipicephalus microplus]|uniref:Uncharacterized protein n=1 Tax=Rhipicephalus microplus TaxID=6941 RepID=A0A9J6EUI9_RHIMP|nr:hypothetical protein HPB51_024295 [Rhipicephalus microplus]